MKNIFFFLIIGILGLLGFLFYQRSAEQVSTETNTTINIDSSTTINEAKKEYEVYAETALDAGKIIAGKIDQGQKNKIKRDSIHLANRQPIWVYQIGSFKSDAEDFEDIYKKLTEAAISNICIIKQSRNSFFLVKNEEFGSKEDLEAKKAELQESLTQASISENLVVKDLHGYCGYEDAVADGDIKIARKVRVECYSCK